MDGAGHAIIGLCPSGARERVKTLWALHQLILRRVVLALALQLEPSKGADVPASEPGPSFDIKETALARMRREILRLPTAPVAACDTR